MKLLFVSTARAAFHVRTPEREPLGGSESCICYLARALAARGHHITLLAHLPPDTPAEILGIAHVPLETLGDAAFFAREKFDAFLCVNDPGAGARLRAHDPGAFNIAWIHVLHNQPALGWLARAEPSLDSIVFVSDSHRASMVTRAPSIAIGNGIAPAFENLFGSAAELLTAKQNRAAYTSTPYRGLEVLIDVMERLRTPIELDLYSSMRTYQQGDEDYEALYARADGNPHIHRHAPVSQVELARRLKPVSIFAYPCIYVETFCIAAAEAMAAELKVVSSDLGALPQTTMGYGDLIPVGEGQVPPEGAMPGYIALLEKNIVAFQSQPEAWAERQFDQVQAVNRAYSWQVRAAEWENFLGPAIAWKKASR